jgi:hypothetical protein
MVIELGRFTQYPRFFKSLPWFELLGATSLKNREAESSPDPREEFDRHSYSITALAQHSRSVPKKGRPQRNLFGA